MTNKYPCGIVTPAKQKRNSEMQNFTKFLKEEIIQGFNYALAFFNEGWGKSKIPLVLAGLTLPQQVFYGFPAPPSFIKELRYAKAKGRYQFSRIKVD